MFLEEKKNAIVFLENSFIVNNNVQTNNKLAVNNFMLCVSKEKIMWKVSRGNFIIIYEKIKTFDETIF